MPPSAVGSKSCQKTSVRTAVAPSSSAREKTSAQRVRFCPPHSVLAWMDTDHCRGVPRLVLVLLVLLMPRSSKAKKCSRLEAMV